MRIRLLFLFALVFIITSSVSFAQEQAGAGRSEVTTILGGGMLFTRANNTETDFRNYVVGAGMTYNFNRFVGVEGELGAGLGVRHTFSSISTVPVTDEDGNVVLDDNGNVVTMQNSTLVRTAGPRTLGYQGNLVLNPTGNDHALVPYVTGGVGGFTMFERAALRDLGLATNETYLTGNVGTGVKWFSKSGWGARVDYRFLVTKGKDNVSGFFGLNENRYAHRVYGSLLYTFGR